MVEGVLAGAIEKTPHRWNMNTKLQKLTFFYLTTFIPWLSRYL